MISLGALFSRERAGGWRARIGFRFDDDAFVGTTDERGFRAARGDPVDADAVLAGVPGGLIQVIYGRKPFAPFEAAGALTVAGDRAAVERFATLFPFPEKVA